MSEARTLLGDPKTYILSGFFEDFVSKQPLRTPKHYAYLGSLFTLVCTFAALVALLVLELRSYETEKTVTVSLTLIEGQQCKGLKYNGGYYDYNFGWRDDVALDGLSGAIVMANHYSGSKIACEAAVKDACRQYVDEIREQTSTMPAACKESWHATSQEAANSMMSMNCPAMEINFDSKSSRLQSCPMTYGDPYSNYGYFEFIYPACGVNGLALSIIIKNNNEWFPLAHTVENNPQQTYDDLVTFCNAKLHEECGYVDEFSQPFACTSTKRRYKSFFEAFGVALSNSRAFMAIMFTILGVFLPYFLPSRQERERLKALAEEDKRARLQPVKLKKESEEGRERRSLGSEPPSAPSSSSLSSAALVAAEESGPQQQQQGQRQSRERMTKRDGIQELMRKAEKIKNQHHERLQSLGLTRAHVLGSGKSVYM